MEEVVALGLVGIIAVLVAVWAFDCFIGKDD